MREINKNGPVLNILSLEDSVQDFEIIREQLIEAGYNLSISRVEKECDFASALRNNTYDIILADFDLPGWDAFAALRLSNDEFPEVPFICVSGALAVETAAKILNAGAVDYVLKDRLEKLPFAVQRALDEGKEKEKRRLAEEAVRESEQNYRTLANSGNTLVWISGTDKLCNYFNLIWLEFTGRTIEQELGNGWTKSIHPDDLHRCLDIYNGAFDRRENFNMEFRLRRNDGVYCWIQCNGCIRHTRTGEFIGYIGHCYDISKRKQEEEALRLSEERFRTIIENTGEGICFINSVGQFVFANHAAEEIFGVNRGELDGINLDQFIVDKQYSFIQKETALKVQGVKSVSETEIVRSNGEKRSIIITAVSQNDNKNCFVGTYTVFRDITEQKLAEEKLHQLSQAIEQSPVSIVITDTNGSIQYVNPKFVQITGYRYDEVIGKNPRILKSGDTPHEDYKQLWKTITMGSEWHGEFHNKKKNGDLYWELASISPIINTQGETTHFLAVKEDITERKKEEEALRQAQKLESIGTLAGGIAHDFNNLLNAIKGQSTLALNKLPKDSLAVNHITKAINASEHATDLTRQLLAYAGKGKFCTKEIDLNLLVKENVNLLNVSVSKITQLRYELGSPSPRIVGDIGQIEQVIMNLIINASDAIGANPGFITVRTSQIELTQNDNDYWKYTNTPLVNGSYALLQVSDTGCGISKDALNRIFDPFYTTKFTGRGLGLSAVLGIIKGHKGGLQIKSVVGNGTTFEIVFPLVTTSKMTEVLEIKKLPVKDGEGKTILIIEDDPFVFELQKDIFTEVNFKVIGASDPLKGIEIYHKEHENISMVILDYSMPWMNGKDAFEKLSQINKEVKVILCSGYSEEETLSSFGIERPTAFFQKPYNTELLVERIFCITNEGQVSN